ncbi:hypothetical protein EDB81DRAFT_373550 [Dactylonectria macrodidyma]|uniref:Uncharacterized protein n=1 Tax=Dactylonectria macrodidyma TaxID=307937 RepID=A0A9P9D095_9HYPO|nr:hypothetical protein EDB81DRAFT_373550 [Dactylonectria macrodidyma]
MSSTPQRHRASQASAVSRRQEQPNEQTNYFECSQCHQSYNRPEHLVRHIRKHTKARPYTCATCDKSFGRQDLLKRHELVHLGGHPSSSRTGIRVTHACKLCASKKSKCSESKPCLRCVAKGIVCEYEDDNSGQDLGTTNEPGTTLPAAAAAGQITEDTESSDEPNDPFLLTFNPFPAASHSDAAQPSPTTVTIMPSTYGEGLQGSAGLLPQDDGALSFSLDWGMGTVDFSALEQMEFDPMDMDIHYTTPTPDGTPDSPPGTIASSAGSDGTARPGPDVYKTLSDVRSWEPKNSDSDQAESRNLAIGHELKFQESSSVRPSHQRALLKQTLAGAPRGRILHMILRVTSPANMAHIMNGFPSAETLTNLINRYILKPRNTYVDDVLHIPTLQLDKQEPELLGAMIAMGSLRTEYPEAHKFGHALQEVVRLSSFQRWEENNGNFRDIGLGQAFLIQSYMGYFSGIGRKCVLAEACSKCLSVLICNGAHMLGPISTQDDDLFLDDPERELTEGTWRSWAQCQSRRRLIYAAYIMDTQVSLAHGKRGLYSFLDIETPFPAAQRLWAAQTFAEWKEQVLALRQLARPQHNPSLRDLMLDRSLMLQQDNAVIDPTFTGLATVGGLWILAQEFHQLDTHGCATSTWSPIILNARRAELLSLLQTRTTSEGRDEPLEVGTLREIVLMHIYVCPETLQLSTRRLLDGNDSWSSPTQYARRWLDSTGCAKALWHAGRVLQAAAKFPPGLLCDVFAFSLFHTAVVLWCYGLLVRSRPRSPGQLTLPGDTEMSAVVIESGKTAEYETLLPPTRLVIPGNRDKPIILSDPVSTVDTVGKILKSNPGCDVMPAGSAKLYNLLGDLGRAAGRYLES